ncbi:MAG TPA: epimerase, partial [Alcanivorax sp.]|nr:epimerase [Alcanivorax sp.]
TVLSNRRLKEEFGYRPEKTSEQAFRLFVDAARTRGQL